MNDILSIVLVILCLVCVIAGFFTGLSQQKYNFKPILKIKWKDDTLHLLIQNENKSRHWIDTKYERRFLKND